MEKKELERLVSHVRSIKRHVGPEFMGDCQILDQAANLLLVHVPTTPEHEWEFYMNGSFCKRCGVAIGSGMPCR